MFMDALQVDEADLGAGQVSDGDREQWSEQRIRRFCA